MGHLERLQKSFNHHSDPLRGHELKQKLDDLKREMMNDWRAYKRSMLMLHGEEVEDNRMDMLLIYLIKRSLLDE
jgi:hypothetical protein